MPHSDPELGDALFVEARVAPDYDGSLSDMSDKIARIFHEDIETASLGYEMRSSEIYSSVLPEDIVSCKVVEYAGADLTSPFSTENAEIVVNIYKMVEDDDDVEFSEELHSCVRHRPLPCGEYDGGWDKLVYNDNIKEVLIYTMRNLMTSSTTMKNKSSTVNRLILLSGPPGTGKTSLGIGLAQKLSITLNTHFDHTVFFQLNAPILLSQFFGQSAQKIHNLFDALASLAKSEPRQLLILLIDEVESLASSRAVASERGEVHDAVRATNTLLTGFDMVKTMHNVLIVCTTNLPATLDHAFLDRVSEHFEVTPPSPSAIYDMLKDGIADLIERRLVHLDEDDGQAFGCSYVDAECKLETDRAAVSCRIRRLAERMGTPQDGAKPVTGRWLSMFAERALVRRRPSRKLPTVADALTKMEEYLDSKSAPRTIKRKHSGFTGAEVTQCEHCNKRTRNKSSFDALGRQAQGLQDLVKEVGHLGQAVRDLAEVFQAHSDKINKQVPIGQQKQGTEEAVALLVSTDPNTSSSPAFSMLLKPE